MSNVYELTFEQPKGSALGAQLSEVIDFLEFIEQFSESQNLIKINLSEIKFIHPLFALALSSLISHLQDKGNESIIDSPNSTACTKYLDLINFPDGLRPDETINWKKVLNKYRGRNYMPIVNFSTLRDSKNSYITNQVLSKINWLIKENLQLDAPYESAVGYLISEITDNIIEHSGVERGWLLTQYYPTTEYLDICIIDTGKSLLGSYKDAGQEIYTDENAIDNALKGISTKSPDRGTGIPTSRSISKGGLEGDFALFSGRSLFYNDNIINLHVSWPGTFVAMRIKKSVEGFNFYSHV